MRFVVLVKANEQSAAGVMPTEQELADMGRFNEELVRAGVMLAGEGLHPSSKGVRISYSGPSQRVIDGPFAEAKELVAGFWILQAPNQEEVIDWLKRAPFADGQVEIRQIFEADDFGEAMTPEVREADDRLRREIEPQNRPVGFGLTSSPAVSPPEERRRTDGGGSQSRSVNGAVARPPQVTPSRASIPDTVSISLSSGVA